MKVKLNDVRLSFANALFEPKQINGLGDPKFSASLVFDPKHPCVADISKAIQEVCKDKWSAKAKEVYTSLKAADKTCLHDGDSKSEYEGYPGNLYLNASNRIKPLVIDGNKAPLSETDGRPYSGCFVNAVIEIWAQDNQFGKRVNASLSGVQFLRDGERLSGGGIADADDFEEIPQAPDKRESGGEVEPVDIFEDDIPF